MSFLSLAFYPLLIGLIILYYNVPFKYRYLVLLAGSYIFYGWGNIKSLPVLISITFLSYVGGGLLQKRKNKYVYIIFFVANILVLVFFKYSSFISNNLVHVLSLIGITYIPMFNDALLPVGLSFYCFQATGYLNDVYRKGMTAIRNPLKYATFISFFPTVLSGPIQRSRDFFPQINNLKCFDSENAIKGTILFIWGLFEKNLVANNLSNISNKIYSNYEAYTSVYYVIAAVSFSLYIYADFSAYSDMARGIAKLFGIEIKKNFCNPYLSTSLSEFWTRWHVTLNDWFVENVYIPLGGNRKGKFRKYINMLIVFLISGLWHGASWHFIAWGGINGVFAVIGLIIKPVKEKFYNQLKVDQKLAGIVFLKQSVVFFFITLTWILFRNDFAESAHIIKSILHFYPVQLFDLELLSILGSAVTTFGIIITTMVFVIVQSQRQYELKYYQLFRTQPILLQCGLLAIVLYMSIFAIANAITVAGSVDVGQQFIYFQF